MDGISVIFFQVLLGALAILITWYILKKKGRYASLSLPPGPRGLPFIGSAFSIPKEFEWITFKEWCSKSASDIIYFQALGQNMIVIDKYETAIELLEKRSGIYSSRPPFPMMSLMGNWDDIQFAFSPYGSRWRSKRRLFHQILNEHTSGRYYPLIQRRSSGLLISLLDDPENYMHHIYMLSASTVLELAYGYGVESVNDPRFVKLETAIKVLQPAAAPGAFYVNLFPALRHVPSWFPGAGFKTYAKKWEVISKEIINETFDHAKKLINEASNPSPSFVSDALGAATPDKALNKEEEEIINSVAQSIYTAGTDTSSAALHMFVVLMALHPDVQIRAQDEISNVSQVGHLPSFHDMTAYPYTNAVIMEVLRWAPVLPLGVPHRIETDDVFRNYHIPAGSTVMANIWSMLHDEEMYPDPDTFRPERFLRNGTINEEVRSPYEVVFGFGRRICPGKHLAFMSLWTNVTSILATLNLGKPEGELMSDFKFLPGLVLHPAPFKCSIKPRSLQAEKLIRESFSTSI